MYKVVRKSGLLTVLALVVSLAAVASASASAVVTVSPGGNVTATAGSSFLTVNPGGASPVTLSCTSASSNTTGTGLASQTRTAYPVPVAGAVAPATPVDSTRGNVLVGFTSCTVARIAFTVRCDGLSNIAVTSITVSQVTPGRVTGINCTLSLTIAGRVCTAAVASQTSAAVPGGVAGRYTNNATAPTLTVDAPTPANATPTNQNLAVWNSGCTSTIPNGPAAFAGPSTTANALIFAVTPTTTSVTAT